MLQTLDLSHFTSGTNEQRQQFVDGLMASFGETGFAKLINHGFSKEQVHEQSKRFFSQPSDVKNEILSGPMIPRGYTGTEVEQTGMLHHDKKIRAMTDTKVRGYLVPYHMVGRIYDTGIGLTDMRFPISGAFRSRSTRRLNLPKPLA